MTNIWAMSYLSLKRYIEFREAQIIKHEAQLSSQEFKEITERIDTLRKEDNLSAIKYAVLMSQVRSMKIWNRENKNIKIMI